MPAVLSLWFGAKALFHVKKDVVQRFTDVAQLHKCQGSAEQLLESAVVQALPPLSALAQAAATRLQRTAGEAEQARKQLKSNLLVRVLVR
ncbi:hypothetical protein ABPG75_000892 [Micractinium tetrahymenae]